MWLIGTSSTNSKWSWTSRTPSSHRDRMFSSSPSRRTRPCRCSKRCSSSIRTCDLLRRCSKGKKNPKSTKILQGRLRLSSSNRTSRPNKVSVPLRTPTITHNPNSPPVASKGVLSSSRSPTKDNKATRLSHLATSSNTC